MLNCRYEKQDAKAALAAGASLLAQSGAAASAGAKREGNMDITRNIDEAIHALFCKPIFSTSAERFLILDELKSLYPTLSQPQRFSLILTALLSRVSVPIEDHDLIAGRALDRLLTEAEEAQFAKYLKSADYPSRHLFWSSGHCTYSWEMLVSEGLPALRQGV